MTRAIISIHIGQCGVQLGNSVWELLCMEHDINKDGKEIDSEMDFTTAHAMETFFTTSSTGRHVPRAIFVDLDPTTIDEIRTGLYRTLYHPGQLISGMEDAASNFARGYYTVGRSVLDKFMFSLRHNVENADAVQGFIISHSPSGGTGGGLGSLLHECVSLCYPKTTKLNVSVLPAPRLSSAAVDPYNTSISSHFTMEHTDISFLVDNEALYNVCHQNLLLPNCSYHHINRIVAQLWSAVTASFRYSGSLNSDLCGIMTNLVPFPRLQFPVCSFAPIANNDIADHQEFNVNNLAREVFRPESRFLQFDPNNGKYMSCIMMFRGEINIADVSQSISNVKTHDLDFVDWCPTGFKITINGMPPAIIPRSLLTPSKSNVTMIANSTAISDVWESVANKTKMLYNKRAFVHWFVSEGMEEGEINDSLENIGTLIQDYRECGLPTDSDNSKSPSKDRSTKVNKSPDASKNPSIATSKMEASIDGGYQVKGSSVKASPPRPSPIQESATRGSTRDSKRSLMDSTAIPETLQE